jgi:hypothetical protein
MSSSAVAKLKAILIIDIMIVAGAAGTYLLLQNQGAFTPRPAEFTLSNLTIDPVDANADEPISISANVTNTGDLEGNYTASLTINDQSRENQTIVLLSGGTSTIEFTDTENVEGNYSVRVGEQTGTFKIKPLVSNISLSRLFINPKEAWIGEEINIKVSAKNLGSANETLAVKFTVDDLLINNTKISLNSGENTTVTFMFNVTTEGSHSVKVNNLKSTFRVVPPGTHTLTVYSSPYSRVSFTINGATHTTSYIEVLPEGKYEMVFATQAQNGHPFGGWSFGAWNTYTSNSLTISLTEATTITAYYSYTMELVSTSCPSLYFWNGHEYGYIQEVSNHGWLGYTRYVNEDGSLEYWRNNPWDYIPLSKSQLQLTNGHFRANLTQQGDEIFFIDSSYLLAVDHPANQEVYSTMVEQYIDPNYIGKIYTVSKNTQRPISACNELVTVYNGTAIDSYGKVDALNAISSTDGILTTGFNGKYSQAWNNQTWNRLTLDLGNLAGSPQIKLVVRAIVDWGPAESYNLWMNKFYSAKVPNHTEPTPIPFMEVKEANGNWKRVPESRQIPMPPDTVARTYVVDLTGLFSTNDYSLRINNFWNVTYDYIGIDTLTQQNVTVQRIDPQAYLRQEFTVNSKSSGTFTRYGDVTSLLLNDDDEFVIGRQGDSVALQFSTENLEPTALGMERDYFFFVACWFKVEYANYGFGPGHNGFTVDPLPFHNMSGFPYPLQTESYPFEAHASYLRDYNTRAANPQSQEASISIWIPVITVIVLFALNLDIFVRFRKRGR